MNERFKKFILFLCIFSFIVMPLRPHRADAVVLVDDVAEVGGGLITTGVILKITGAVLVAGGATYVANNWDSNCGKYVADRMISTGIAAQELSVKVDDAGKKFISLTKDGIDWFKSTIDDYFSATRPGTVGYTFDGDKVYISFSPIPADAENGVCLGSVDLGYGTYKESWLGNVSVEIRHYNTHVSAEVYIDGDFYSTYASYPDSLFNDGDYSICIPFKPYVSGWQSVDNNTFNDRAGSINIPLGNDVIGSDGTVATGQNVSGGTSVYTPSGSISIPVGSTWGDVSGQFAPDVTFPTTDTPAVPTTGDTPIDTPVDTPSDTTGEATQEGSKPWVFNIPILGDILKILMKILEVLKSIPLLLQKIIDWLSIDWSEVAQHINYTDILKEHFKPFFDIADLLTNIQSSSQSSNGKFYMTIPKEMGGSGQEQCVLDLTIGSVYVQTGRDIIKYGIWIGFLWYVLKTFSPKFNIG